MTAQQCTLPLLSDNQQQLAGHSVLTVSENAPEHSDGLAICRRRSSLAGRYTRADCRCGMCPWNDPEPCPYAQPTSRRPSRSSDSGYIASLRNSFSRAFSWDGKAAR